MLQFIGRGSAFNTGEGNTSAFLKYNGGHSMILIDCGESTFSDISALGLMDGVSELDVLITHTHPDHIGSLGSLIFYCFYIANIKVRILQTTPSINNSIKKILHHNGVEENMYEFVKEIPYVAEFVKIFHVKNIESVMYVLQGLGSRPIVYTGDTCDITAICRIKNKYKDAIVYTDCCVKDYPGNPHLSIDVLINNTNPNERKDFYCMHIDDNSIVRTILDTGFNMVYRIFRAEVLTENLKGNSYCHLSDLDGQKIVCVYDTNMQLKGKCLLSKIQMKI